MPKQSHPYPDHIRDAVAETIASQVLVNRTWEELADLTQDAFQTDANQVLETIWDASRVTTMKEVEALPENTLLHASTGTLMTAGVMADAFRWTHLPARIIHWEDDHDD